MNYKNRFLFAETYLSILLFLLILWTLLLWLFKNFFGQLQFDKIPKQELVNYYGVDKKTVNKWVKYFCSERIDFTSYKQQRKLDLHDYMYIIITLGNPKEFSIYSKQKIIEECEGTYTSLRHSIDEYADRFGISGDTFRRIHKFPPNISQQIIRQYD